MTPEQILKIPVDEPERIFSDPANLLQEYHILAKEWHPDSTHSNTDAVFEHIVTLYKKALDKKEKGTWSALGQMILTATDGKKYSIHFVKKHNFELGEFFISRKVITYLIKPEFRDLYENAIYRIKNFSFASDQMRTEVSRYLPSIVSTFETNDYLCVVIEKDEDMILLKDVLNFAGGKLGPKHVAWITSRLYNLACYQQYAELTNNAISLENYFISPKRHMGFLPGWWYARKVHEPLLALPERTNGLIPASMIVRNIADHRIDFELIRATGRELLNESFETLRTASQAPRPMANWFRFVSSGDAFTDYKSWDGVLFSSFGEKKFVPLDIQFNQVYTNY